MDCFMAERLRGDEEVTQRSESHRARPQGRVVQALDERLQGLQLFMTERPQAKSEQSTGA